MRSAENSDASGEKNGYLPAGTGSGTGRNCPDASTVEQNMKKGNTLVEIPPKRTPALTNGGEWLSM